MIPLAALNFAQFSLQSVVSSFVFPDLFRDKRAVARIEPGDQLRNEMRVLGCFVSGWKARTGRLALSSIPNFSILGFPIVNLALDFLLQNLEIEVAQCIWTESAALESVGRRDVGVFLQQLGDPAEDGRFYAIGSEGLEQ